ncbi:MAG: cardiolipin synthase [Xanthomonadales bacterium]|nr:cardiolipin synthase [Xanthomonadales bacterium]
MEWLVFLGGAATALAGTIIQQNLAWPEKRILRQLDDAPSVDQTQFLREVDALLGPPVLSGNRVSLLQNGEQIFPAMLEAIRSAERSITFETYIYWSGEVGDAFAEALCERASAGVAVHVLIDWVGSQRIARATLQRMREAGVDVRLYRPLHFYQLWRMNNRTHRKLLVIDGRIGFTGGVGIADLWRGHAANPSQWRDLHFRVTGPVVAQMQAAFLDNWIRTTGQVLRGHDYFPSLQEADGADRHDGDHPVRAQMFTSSPNGGSDSMQLMYLLAIASARKSIDIAAAYFIPDRLILAQLRQARRRGVRIRVIMPHRRTDIGLVRHASRRLWGRLLRHGARLYLYEHTMYHAKMLIVDQALVSVGSTNFDSRSFRLNDEASLNIYDEAFGAAATAVFEADLAQSRPVAWQRWLRRSWWSRLRERIAGLVDSQL